MWGIHVLADNDCSQNKNKFLFSLFSTVVTQGLLGGNRISMSLMCVGHTKFALDPWNRILRSEQHRVEVNCFLGKVQAVITCCRREGSNFLGKQDGLQVLKFTYSPFDDSLNCVSLNPNEFYSRFFRAIVGKN